MSGDRGSGDDAFDREWRARFERFGRMHTDDAGVAGWSATGLDARVRRFLEVFPDVDRSGEPWLDAGCGAGTYLGLLERSGARALGLDYAFSTLQHARTKGGEAVHVVGDAMRLPLASDSVRGVLCFGVTQAVSSSRRVASELARVVQPGGEIWIDGLNAWALSSGLARLGRRLKGKKHRHLRYERPGRLRRALEAVGLVDVSLYWLPLAPSSMPGLQRVLEAPAVVALLKLVYPLAALVSHSFILRARRPGQEDAGARPKGEHAG